MPLHTEFGGISGVKINQKAYILRNEDREFRLKTAYNLTVKPQFYRTATGKKRTRNGDFISHPSRIIKSSVIQHSPKKSAKMTHT